MHSCMEAVGFDTPSGELFYIPKRLDSNGVSGPDSSHAIGLDREARGSRFVKASASILEERVPHARPGWSGTEFGASFAVSGTRGDAPLSSWQAQAVIGRSWDMITRFSVTPFSFFTQPVRIAWVRNPRLWKSFRAPN